MPTSPSEHPDGAGNAAHPRGTDAPLAFDLVVIGAGPAGLAGAVSAGEGGLRVALVDLAELTGGQFYRQPAPALRARRPQALHHAWSTYADLRDRLARCPRITHLSRHHVWSVVRHDDHGGREVREGDGGHESRTGHDSHTAHRWTIHALTGPDATDRTPVRLTARGVLLATGAVERQLPFPGWTLPGVVSAGGAQAMLKSGLVLPGRRTVVAGSGPLLLAAATSLAAAGAVVPTVVEATGYLDYARHAAALAANPGKLAEAAAHGTSLLRHRIPLRTHSAVTEAHGTRRVEAVTVQRLDRQWRPVPGTARRIPCDAVAVGHGLVPQTDLAGTLGCALHRTPDGAYAPVTGRTLETSVPTVWAAGESGGIGGAELALAEGELAGLAAVVKLAGGLVPPAARTTALRRRITRLRAFADAMAAVHAPRPGWRAWLGDDTEVCRCEEVTAGRVREAVDELGARDTRTVKLLTRAGMGWCQGRICSTAVTCLTEAATVTATATAAETATPESQLAPDRRPLAAPVPLSVLARQPAPAARPGPTPPPPAESS